jgi:hypothetical protein
MKFKEERPFATPDAAEQKLLELANAMEADHAGRLSVSVINRQFRDAGGSYKEYGAAVKAAIALGWLTMHPSGGYLKFTQAGAGLFAVSMSAFESHCRLKSDIVLAPKSAAISGSRRLPTRPAANRPG